MKILQISLQKFRQNMVKIINRAAYFAPVFVPREFSDKNQLEGFLLVTHLCIAMPVCKNLNLAAIITTFFRKCREVLQNCLYITMSTHIKFSSTLSHQPMYRMARASTQLPSSEIQDRKDDGAFVNNTTLNIFRSLGIPCQGI